MNNSFKEILNLLTEINPSLLEVAIKLCLNVYLRRNNTLKAAYICSYWLYRKDIIFEIPSAETAEKQSDGGSTKFKEPDFVSARNED